jgi:hypothetical protein
MIRIFKAIAGQTFAVQRPEPSGVFDARAGLGYV